jgi:uncharacterized protein (DUF433 family)
LSDPQSWAHPAQHLTLLPVESGGTEVPGARFAAAPSRRFLLSAEPKTYVWEDEHGALRVGSSRVMLDGVIVGWREGQSPEAIQDSYPELSLEEVYEAFTYILAHPEEIETYWLRQQQGWETDRLGSEAENSDFLQRLRAFRVAEASGPAQ